MTKTFNKENITSIEGGYVVVDKTVKDYDQKGWWLYMDKYIGGTCVMDEKHIRLKDNNGVHTLYAKDGDYNKLHKIIASIGKRIKGVPLIEEVDKDSYLFSAFKSEEAYRDNEPYFSQIFSDHTEMKVFSSKHSAKDKKEYPEYVSNYWKIETAQSKGQYSKEDMRKLYEGTLQNVGTCIKKEDMPTWEEVLEMLKRQSLQTKRPISVELEYEYEHYVGIGKSPFKESDGWEMWGGEATMSAYRRIKLTNPETNTIIPIKIEYENT